MQSRRLTTILFSLFGACLALLILPATPVAAQGNAAPELYPHWVRQFDRSARASITALAVDSDGNSFQAGVIWGQGPGNVGSLGYGDMSWTEEDGGAFLFKHSAAGTLLWHKVFGTN